MNFRDFLKSTRDAEKVLNRSRKQAQKLLKSKDGSFRNVILNDELFGTGNKGLDQSVTTNWGKKLAVNVTKVEDLQRFRRASAQYKSLKGRKIINLDTLLHMARQSPTFGTVSVGKSGTKLISNRIKSDLKTSKSVNVTLMGSRFDKAGLWLFYKANSVSKPGENHKVTILFRNVSNLIQNYKIETQGKLLNYENLTRYIIERTNCAVDCDCKRFNYWFRFKMTMLSAAAGREETAPPKDRNAKLTGAFCHHLIKAAMTTLSPGTISVLAKRIAKYDKDPIQKTSNRQMTKKEQEEAKVGKESLTKILKARKEFRNLNKAEQNLKSHRELTIKKARQQNINPAMKQQLEAAREAIKQFGFTAKDLGPRMGLKPEELENLL